MLNKFRFNLIHSYSFALHRNKRDVKMWNVTGQQFSGDSRNNVYNDMIGINNMLVIYYVHQIKTRETTSTTPVFKESLLRKIFFTIYVNFHRTWNGVVRLGIIVKTVACTKPHTHVAVNVQNFSSYIHTSFFIPFLEGKYVHEYNYFVVELVMYDESLYSLI